MKNDTILGPLRHSGYVTTMLMAISWPASGLHMTTCWIHVWLTKYLVSFAEKIPHRRIEVFFLPITGKVHALACSSASLFTVLSHFNRAEKTICPQEAVLCKTESGGAISWMLSLPLYTIGRCNKLSWCPRPICKPCYCF